MEEKLSKTRFAALKAEQQNKDILVMDNASLYLRLYEPMDNNFWTFFFLAIYRAGSSAGEKGKTHVIERSLLTKNYTNEELVRLFYNVMSAKMFMDTNPNSESEGSISLGSIFPEITIDKIKEGMIHFKFGDKLAELLKGSDLWTDLSIPTCLKFRSKFSLKGYHLGCRLASRSNEYARTQTVSVEDLRKFMDIKDDTYPRFPNFKQRVLDAAKREIDLYSHFTIDFEPIKQGRKVKDIRICVKRKNKDEIEDLALELNRSIIGRLERLEKRHEPTVGQPFPPDGKAKFTEYEDIPAKFGNGHPINVISTDFTAWYQKTSGKHPSEVTPDSIRKAFETYVKKVWMKKPLP